MLFKHSYISKAKGGDNYVLDLFIILLDLMIWKNGTTKMKWRFQIIYKNTVWHFMRMRTREFKYYKSVASPLK